MADEIPQVEEKIEAKVTGQGRVAVDVSTKTLGDAVSGVKESPESQEVRIVFKFVDENSDGKISRVELANFLKKLEHSNLTDRQIDCLLKVYDENGSGHLEFDEFLKLYRSLKEGEDEDGKAVHEEEELFYEAFNVFDRNKDGLISPAELQLIVQSLNLGKGKTPCDFSAMIQAVDTDGDGFVDIKEFTKLMQSNLYL